MRLLDLYIPAHRNLIFFHLLVGIWRGVYKAPPVDCAKYGKGI